MRERTDRWIGIGSVIAVAVVPTVLVLMPWKQAEPAGARSMPGPAAGTVEGQGAPTSSPSPSPSPSSGLDAAPPTLTGQNAATVPARAARSRPGGRSGGDPSRPGGTTRYAPADNGARITGVQWLGKRRADISVASPALGSTQKVRLLLPRKWSATATRTWPVVYAFHGGNDTYISWTRSTDISKVAAGYDVLVAMPEGSNGSYTDWYNNGNGGPPQWETFHTQEVRQLLERNFRAGGSRAAMGISSGAQGAVTYAARHPGMFRYTAAYSGVLSMLSPGVPALLLYVNSQAGQDATRIWGDPVRDRANWAAHDPASLAANLRGTGVYVSAGNGRPGPMDPPGTAPWDIRYLSETQVERTSRQFAERAKTLGVAITTDFYGPGSHSWGYWKREMHQTWPTIMRAIGARKVSP